MTSEIAACVRCGVMRHIHARRQYPVCASCSALRVYEPDDSCSLPPGVWVQNKGVWRWQAGPPLQRDDGRDALGHFIATAQCGTESGYGRHRKRGQEACDECREAHRIYRRQQRRQEAA